MIPNVFRALLCVFPFLAFAPRATAQLAEATALLAFLNEAIQFRDALSELGEDTGTSEPTQVCNASCLGVKAYQKGEFQEAVRQLRIASNEGDPEAQKTLGLMYYTGDGVSENLREGMKWLHMAADQGEESAQLSLGVIYATSESVVQDFAEAERWFLLAGDQGNVEAQFALGQLYILGGVVSKNPSQALYWLNLAAAQDYEPALEARDTFCEARLELSECIEVIILRNIKMLSEKEYIERTSEEESNFANFLVKTADDHLFSRETLVFYHTFFQPDPGKSINYLKKYFSDCEQNTFYSRAKISDPKYLIYATLDVYCAWLDELEEKIELFHPDSINIDLNDIDAITDLAVAYDIGFPNIEQDKIEALDYYYIMLQHYLENVNDDEYEMIAVVNSIRRLCKDVDFLHEACL